VGIIRQCASNKEKLAALVLVLAVTYINCAPSEAAESNSENDQTFFNIFCKALVF
jgi:hypothetical protein